MSAAPKGRGLFREIFKNIAKSFRILKYESKQGNFMGEDLNGNKYYEHPADPSIGKRLPKRSFEPLKEMHFDVDNMPAEWDAWLRNRRKDPPTIDELKSNLAIAQMKQENARKLLEKEGKDPDKIVKHSHMTNFPQYKEFEVNPGKGTTKFDS